MAGTTSTTLDDFKSVLIAEARYVAQNKANLANVVRRIDFEPGQATVKVPFIPAQTAASLTEGNELNNTEVSSLGVTLDPSVVGWRTILTENASWNNPAQAAQLGAAAADAIVAKMNQSLFAAGAGFTATLGASGVDLTASGLREARTKLAQLNVVSPILAATPEVIHDLLTDLSSGTGGNYVMSDNLRTAISAGEMPPLYGIRILEVTSGIDESGNVVCPIFDPNALVLGVKWDFKVDMLYRPSFAGWEIAVTSCYDAKCANVSGGVSFTCDGADS